MSFPPFRLLFLASIGGVAAPLFGQTSLPGPAIQRVGTNGADVELKLGSTAGNTYRVFRSATLAANSWQDTGVSAPGTGALLTLTVPGTGSLAKQFFRIEATPTTGPGFVAIGGGAFIMGDQSVAQEGNPNERPAIEVGTGGYQIKAHEVTKAEWDATAAYASANGYTFSSNAGQGKAADHPVHSVSWYDVVKWCNAKSEQDGLEPCYFNGVAIYKTGSPSTVTWNPVMNGYRLPCESEWEKAARGGLVAKRFPGGDLINHSLANYVANPATYTYDTNATSGSHPTYSTGATPYTAPAGSFSPNGVGLYDMAGNLLEWCWDDIQANDYQNGYVIDLTSGSSTRQRVVRGGSWLGQAAVARVSRRGSAFPDTGKGNDVGFRIVRGSLQ